MRFHAEGEWTVSSPVYLGDEVSVQRAMLCAHEFWDNLSENEVDGAIIQVERCKSCIAVRTRTRPLKKGEGE